MKTILYIILASLTALTAQVDSIPVLELKIETEFLRQLNEYRRTNKLDTIQEDCFMKEVSGLNTRRIVNNDSLCFKHGTWNSVQEMRDAFHYGWENRKSILWYDSIKNPNFKDYNSYQEITISWYSNLDLDYNKYANVLLKSFMNSKDHNVVLLNNLNTLTGVKCSIKIYNGYYKVGFNVCFSRLYDCKISVK